MSFTRRRWLQGSAALGAAAVTGVVPSTGCGDNLSATGLVLEAESTRAIVAVWSATGGRATVRVLTADGGPAGRWTVPLAADGTGWVDATGLAPATGYVARVITDEGHVAGDFAFTTAPRDDDPRPCKLAVGADVDESSDYASPIFDAVVDEAPDFFVSLGDWPYADNGPPAVTRGEYHERYVGSRLEPRFQAWLRATSFRAIYDDHEYVNDWDAMRAAADPARLAAALGAWDAWFPHRGGPRYRQWRWGGLVECFLLDCRAFRSANDDPDEPGKTMLGAEQRAWLLAGLATSTAPFCLVFTSVPLDFGHGVDHWAGYTAERDAIFDELRALGRPGVLFIAGDQHWFAAHRHAFGLREMQFGPLSRSLIPPPADQPPGVITRISLLNFGVIEVDATPRLTVRAVGATGETLYTESFAPGDLTPR